MFRIALFGIVVSALVGGGKFMPDSSEEAASSLLLAENLDPIIVGHTISDEHKERWLVSSQKYRECGLCGEELQAFPGD